MAFEPQIWSNVAVESQTVLGAAVAVASITNADPPVATATGHAYEEGEYVLLRLSGARGYDTAVVRVGTVGADTFVLLGLDGVDVAGAAGTAQKVTFGAAAAVFTEVSASGAETEDVLIKTIHTTRGYNRPGTESPLVYSLTALWVPDDPVLVEFSKAQRAGELRAVRFTFENGVVGLFAGYPSASKVPTGSAGAVVSTPAKVSARGFFATYAGA